jgi:hypothetical protein
LAGFTGVVVGTLAVSAVASAASLEPRSARAASLGGLLAGLNALAAYGLVLWSRGRSNAAFMKAILGGLAVRLLALVLAVVVALRVLGVSETPFVVSLLLHFVLFLLAELWLVQRGGRLGAAS